MLEGIAYLHGMGIIHRDIKGSNFLLDNEGNLKYCDFGLARLVDKNKIIMTTRVITRWYRAPELFLGEQFYDEKVDIWSIGCVFLELITNGLTPFKGEDDADTIRLIGARCPFPRAEEWPGMDKLPNYSAFKNSLYGYFCKQPNSPQSFKTTSHGSVTLTRPASSIPEFLEKYGYLWNKKQQINRYASPQARRNEKVTNVSPLQFNISENRYASPDMSYINENLCEAEKVQLGELSEICQLMLTVYPNKRPSANKLLSMPFFTSSQPLACKNRDLL